MKFIIRIACIMGLMLLTKYCFLLLMSCAILLCRESSFMLFEWTLISIYALIRLLKDIYRHLEDVFSW